MLLTGPSTPSLRRLATGASSSILATAFCLRRRSPMSSGWLRVCVESDVRGDAARPKTTDCPSSGSHRVRRGGPCTACGLAARWPLSLAEGVPHHRGHRLDGGHALFATALRL